MNDGSIAYFSMEMALRPDMPTYSGGLGVLAGDTIRSAADLKLPMVAVTLVHRQGYFAQKLGQVVLPAFYQKRDDWLCVMRHSIALNASHFNTQRMVQQYVVKAYFE